MPVSALHRLHRLHWHSGGLLAAVGRCCPNRGRTTHRQLALLDLDDDRRARRTVLLDAGLLGPRDGSIARAVCSALRGAHPDSGALSLDDLVDVRNGSARLLAHLKLLETLLTRSSPAPGVDCPRRASRAAWPATCPPRHLRRRSS